MANNQDQTERSTKQMGLVPYLNSGNGKLFAIPFRIDGPHVLVHEVLYAT